ncbi:hypothetical protein [Nonomuraea sp. SYSU D8015]|uniref:hypothetical protein n=1 Tax=Nonomuraea sp. SYSU D8015 TaxID=2593644 RepID=UPI001CB72C2C|nr:hypothetical protein [Nonomuraea sp. SYSU D8015]
MIVGWRTPMMKVRVSEYAPWPPMVEASVTLTRHQYWRPQASVPSGTVQLPDDVQQQSSYVRHPDIDGFSHTSNSKLIVPPDQVVAVALNVGVVVISCRPLSGAIEVSVGAGGGGQGPISDHPVGSRCGGNVLRLAGMFWMAFQTRLSEWTTVPYAT